jgi:hypothetical protein
LFGYGGGPGRRLRGEGYGEGGKKKDGKNSAHKSLLGPINLECYSFGPRRRRKGSRRNTNPPLPTPCERRKVKILRGGNQIFLKEILIKA